MTFHLVTVLGFIFLCIGNSDGQSIAHEKKVVVPGRVYKTKADFDHKLYIYCYKGISKHFLHIWQTVYLSISLNPNEYELYHGTSVENVLQMYENRITSWIYQLLSWKADKIDLNPFSLSCVGVGTAAEHEVSVNVIRIDFWRVFQLACGILLYYSAPKLSSNPIFYYICGVTLGITTSFFITLYLLSKLISKKPTMYAVFIGGWSVGVYLFQLLYENLKIIATTYHTHVLLYLVVTGLISFIVCYRFGPVTDPRSKNLIKWAIQAFALVLIFYSSRCQEASVLFLLILLFYFNFPKEWSLSFFNLWARTFPKKRKFVSEDEYHEEGVRETVKALENLRKYCSSNECNQWKTVLSLQKPIRYNKSRFAQFMEGSSHLDDSEILAYESELHKSQPQLTDDSDISED